MSSVPSWESFQIGHNLMVLGLIYSRIHHPETEARLNNQDIWCSSSPVIPESQFQMYMSFFSYRWTKNRAGAAWRARKVVFWALEETPLQVAHSGLAPGRMPRSVLSTGGLSPGKWNRGSLLLNRQGWVRAGSTWVQGWVTKHRR